VSPGAPGGPSFQDRLERFVQPFFRDSALWPITFVLLAHLVVGLAVVLLGAVRARGPLGLAALAGLLFVTGDLLWRDLARRRLGPLAGSLVVCWGLAAVTAWFADRSGLY